jgi:O-Antigen ligase
VPRPRPVWALYALVVGLALHNVVMAELWELGVRGLALDVVSAWKEVLLAAGLAAVVWMNRGVPFKATAADWLGLAYAAVVIVWFALPESWLGGSASFKMELYALRHDLLPVAAYFFGRGLGLRADEMRRVVILVIGTAAAVAVFGLVDVYLVPLQWWRDSGVPGWYREQLGLRYTGLSGLPENFVYNAGGHEVFRRLTSTFLSPLATSYMLLVALLVATAWRRRTWALWAAPVLFAGLLWTHSRFTVLAYAAGLCVLAWAGRHWWPAVLALVTVAVAFFFFRGYDDFGPKTSFTRSELVIQDRGKPQESHDPFSAGESSTASHWRNLRDGVETVLRHPWGYGPGNAGVTAFRTGTELKAGESTYTELGVEAGLLGALLFIAWSVAVVRRVWPRSAWLAAALVATLLLGIQTDVIGVPWLAFVLWALAGDQS